MSAPLGELTSEALNVRSGSQMPLDSPKAPEKQTADGAGWDNAPSSPFDINVDFEAASPPAKVHSEEILLDLASPGKETPQEPASPDSQAVLKRSLREDVPHMSPEKSPSKPQSPNKASEPFSPTKSLRGLLPQDHFSPTKSPTKTPSRRTDHAADFEENVFAETHVDEFEYHESTMVDVDEHVNIDDTCFSTFSEVPDMTVFAKIGQRSPTKSLVLDQLRTPRACRPTTPGTARAQTQNGERSPSPTPRRSNHSRHENETANLLLDFTEQFEAISNASWQSQAAFGRNSPTKSRTEPNLLSYINGQRTPGRNRNVPGTPVEKRSILNLLDFELPPAPTPRSIPTITVRELESLKSSYLSQISSLTASLSGKEAEVDSLKKAVGDAERRVGEAQEAVREERSLREHAEKEKAEWEKRGSEVERVMKSIKEEIITSEKEREELVRKLEECERKAEEAEARAHEAETRALEAENKIVDQSVMVAGDDQPKFTAEEVQKQIDEKVANLCRELHVVYKKKHETKVAALKKSYEVKAEKKHAELQRRVKELAKQNEELQASKDATLSGVVPSDFSSAAHEADLKRLEEQKAEIEEQKAKLAGMAEELRSVRHEYTCLLKELEKERVEKGELVAAVDEMLALQTDQSSAELATPAALAEEPKRSVPRPSGLRGPGFGIAGGESKIGRFGAPPSGFGRSLSGGKSRMMSNIERMGGRSVD